MEKTPMISVIIPIYKTPDYIDRCVESVCSQSYSNLEIILVDDGSPDECPKICDEWTKKDSRIKAVHKINGGLSDARNAGLEVSRGEYISFIDGDDWVEKDFFTVLMKVMLEKKADISEVMYRYCIDGEHYENTELSFVSNTLTRDEAMKYLIENSIPQVVWNKLYKKELIKDILFEVGKYHEDEFWSYQVIDKVIVYARSPYIGYNYFQRKDSIMGASYSLKRLDAIEAKVCRQKYLEEKEDDLSILAKKNLLFASFFHGQCALRELSDDEKNQAINFLMRVFKENKLSFAEMKGLKLSHKVWLVLGNASFKGACKIRNKIGIGI